jgi:hypothetical protein
MDLAGATAMKKNIRGLIGIGNPAVQATGIS